MSPLAHDTPARRRWYKAKLMARWERLLDLNKHLPSHQARLFRRLVSSAVDEFWMGTQPMSEFSMMIEETPADLFVEDLRWLYRLRLFPTLRGVRLFEVEQEPE